MLLQESNSISHWYIFYQKFVTFIRTGRTLHYFFIVSLILFIVFLTLARFREKGIISTEGILTLFFLSICLTTELDAYSRYQNYKLIKDLLYEYGFRIIVLKPFSKSSCQRDAAIEAARQLKIYSNVAQYFYILGYRWYHIIPSLLIENPLKILTKSYWISTFFVTRYKSKYFIW